MTLPARFSHGRRTAFCARVVTIQAAVIASYPDGVRAALRRPVPVTVGPRRCRRCGRVMPVTDPVQWRVCAGCSE